MAKQGQKNKGVSLSKLGELLIVAALRLLKKNGDMSLGDLAEALKGDRRIFSAAWEISPSQRRPRWYIAMASQATRFERAGLLLRESRVWSLTGQAETLLAEHSRPESDGEIIAWVDNKARARKTSPLFSPSQRERTEDADIVEADGIAEMGGRARREIEEWADGELKKFIQGRVNPYDFQDLVAALLRAMGYFITYLADRPGGDGGVDIVAHEDPLGKSGVRLKVQVKRYRENVKPTSKDVRELQGLLKTNTDIGVFVCASDFPRGCHDEVNKESKRLRLIDGNEFIRLWIEFYSKMPEEDRKRLPLYMVHFLDEESISEES